MINQKRSDHLYWVNVFNTDKKIEDIRVNKEKTKILKITKNQLIDFKNSVLKIENIKDNLNKIIFEFNNIDFGLWDYKFCKTFFKNQNEFFEIIKTKENTEFIRISKNLLIRNIDNFINVLDREIDNIEILRIKE